MFPKYLLLGSALLAITACDSSNNDVQTEVVESQTGMAIDQNTASNVQIGTRPYYLIDKLAESELKTKLASCEAGPFYKTDFSIAHRGAALQYPEHTKESYTAGARMGAGIVECDVTFTKDKALVCRHSQCDLHTTTNILSVPELASQCTTPFTPADLENGVSANAKCCTSDITLNEFKLLKGKMDGFNSQATTVEAYMAGTPDFRTEVYSNSGTLMTHAESIELFKTLNVKMTPELKAPEVIMPFDGFSQQDYADKMLNEYRQAGVEPEKVFPQSFNLADVKHWIQASPEFGKQAVFLDDRYNNADFNPMNANTWSPTMNELITAGVKIIAPPIWVLITTNSDNQIVPSNYALDAKAAGLDIIAWTFERSGNYPQGGGWYYQSVSDAITHDADQLIVLDVLAQQIGVKGVFSDWPGTVSYYASCMEL